jgi:hypothetical protein
MYRPEWNRFFLLSLDYVGSKSTWLFGSIKLIKKGHHLSQARGPLRHAALIRSLSIHKGTIPIYSDYTFLASRRDNPGSRCDLPRRLYFIEHRVSQQQHWPRPTMTSNCTFSLLLTSLFSPPFANSFRFRNIEIISGNLDRNIQRPLTGCRFNVVDMDGGHWTVSSTRILSL